MNSSDHTTVMLVEDEVSLGTIVKESLELRGFEVMLQRDGMQALEALKDNRPDIYVLDVMLPGLDGFNLARRIRTEDQDTPILFLTAKSQPRDVVEGFELGGDDYLKKPFSMEELIVRIKSLLGPRKTKAKAAASAEDLILIGQYRFDPTRQTLEFDGAQKRLTHREAGLLKMLWEHRGGVLDRAESLQTLWGDDSVYNARSMDVFITKLRRHLKLDPAVEIINVRGVGYKLVC